MPTHAEIQQTLDELCTERGIPGAVCGIVADGEVTVAASGVANLNTGLPVVRETLFQAGSIGKSYTATAIMQLVDEGRLDLDTPVREYLPDLRFADAGVSQTLTGRQILTHTAGIDGDRLDEDFACGRGDDCLARYVSSLADLPLITAPGGLWSYCNSGYVVLGRVIEVLTGMTYEQALTTRLLEPIGATDTLFFPGDMVTHSLAVGHVRQGDSPAVVAPKWEMSRAAGPAGATINTTIDDLLTFARLHLAGGIAGDGTRVLSEASTLAMRQPEVSCPEPELLGDHWGLGWFLRAGAGPAVVGHDGNTIGLTACLRLIPERNVAWALLINLAGQNWAAMEVGRRAHRPMARDGDAGPPRADSRSRSARSTRWSASTRASGSRLTVTSNGDGLLLDLASTADSDGDREQGRLFPVGDQRFVLRLAALGDDLPATFMERAGDGRYEYLHLGARLHRRRR